MQAHAFDTPEAAALGGLPGADCRVVASATEGDDAYVLLDTGPAGRPYLYGVNVARADGGWVEGTSGNGPGWTCTDPERELGTATAWGEAPKGADRVRAAFGDDAREAAASDGIYLVAWWRVPCGPDDYPSVEAYRIGGRWVPDPSKELIRELRRMM